MPAVTYSVVGQWQGEVVVRNSGSTTISAWTLSFTFSNGQVITQLWNGTLTQSGAAVTVRPSGTNAVPANLSCR